MDSQRSSENCSGSVTSNTTESNAGCGCPNNISVHITPTTGGNFTLTVEPQSSVDNLKKLVSKKLKVHKERICLLYRDKQLRDGNLQENGLVDGSRLTLLPSVETGLLTQRPELSVMQALESLNDSQINDFLSGKAPLNLTMRLGDHMMLIQLQLSTVSTAGGSSTSTSSPSKARTRISRDTNRQVLISNLASALSVSSKEEIKTKTSATTQTATISAPVSAGPIQSLSDLASRPTVPVPTAARIPQSRPTAGTSSADPIAAGLTSCLCHSLAPPCTCPSAAAASITPAELPADAIVTAAASETAASVVSPTTSPQIAQRLDPRALAQASRNLTQTLRQLSSEVLSSRELEARSQGAIIESMQHHGRGVYSGTFSGTLNPALQDSRGRPRRDISTIVHILNDLLCATPAVRRPQTASSPSSKTSPCECARCSRRCAYGECEGHSGPCLNTTGIGGMSLADESDPTAVQNSRTRGKLEQLRLVMGERRERRRLRKQKLQPYSLPGATETSTSTDTVSA